MSSRKTNRIWMLRHASAKSHRCELQSQLQGQGDTFIVVQSFQATPLRVMSRMRSFGQRLDAGQTIGNVAVAVPLAPRCV